MFLVSTYTSAKSWTSKPPLHSAVVAEEWCQAKSWSTSKISDCVFIPVSFSPNLLSEDFFYVFTNNVERYTLSDEFFPLLYVRHLTFFLSSLTLFYNLVASIGWQGPRIFSALLKQCPIWGLKNSLNNFVTDCYYCHAYVIVKRIASFDPV